MRRAPRLNEDAMQSAELQIPQLATQAGRAAHQRATENQTSPLVMKSSTGQLVMRATGGGDTVVIKNLPASTPSRAGTVLIRASRPSKKASAR
jgi:hypothetical protein